MHPNHDPTLNHSSEPDILTIRLDSEFEMVLAVPSDLSTVKAAARCLKASVSVPPPATSNSCRSNSIDVYVLPLPLAPATQPG